MADTRVVDLDNMPAYETSEYHMDFSDPLTLYEAEAHGEVFGNAVLTIRPVHHLILRRKRIVTVRPEGSSPEDFAKMFADLDRMLRRG